MDMLDLESSALINFEDFVQGTPVIFWLSGCHPVCCAIMDSLGNGHKKWHAIDIHHVNAEVHSMLSFDELWWNFNNAVHDRCWLPSCHFGLETQNVLAKEFLHEINVPDCHQAI